MHVNIYIYIYILVYTRQTDILWALICCITQLNYRLSQSDVLASKNKLPLLLDYFHENPISEERRSDLTLILFSKWCLLNKRKQLIRLTYPQLLTGSLMNWFRTSTHVTANMMIWFRISAETLVQLSALRFDVLLVLKFSSWQWHLWWRFMFEVSSIHFCIFLIAFFSILSDFKAYFPMNPLLVEYLL